MSSRRGFLTGSALFAAALLAAGARAGDEKPKQDDKQKDDRAKEEDPFAEEDKAPKQILRDADGREYRVCPQCGANMYRQGRTWTCENCGYSYVE